MADKSFKIKNSLNLEPQSSPPSNAATGDMYMDAAGIAYRYNGSSWVSLATPIITNAQILVGDASNVGQSVAMSGDATISNTGALTIANSAITNAKVSASAAIARSKLASGTANHVLINDGTGVSSSEATLAKSRGGAGADMSSVTFPSTGIIVTEAATETLTNKTIDAASNTISNIANANVSTTAAIAHTKLANITAASVLMGNASNVPTATAVTGDVTISSSGVTDISAGVILNADVNASAAIAHTKLANITAGSVLMGNASNNPTATALSGDVTVGNTGVTAIGATKVTNGMLAGSIASSKLVGSDIATVGTITSGTWTGTAIAAANGGTGQTSFTKGDLLAATGASAIGKLGVGSNDQVLISDSTQTTGLKWGSTPAGTPTAPITKTTTYTATTSDETILVDGSGGAWTLSLYTAVGNAGRKLYIKRTDDTPANAVTIDPNGTETIQGSTTKALYTKNEAVSIQSDGTNWQVVSHFASTPWTSTTLTFAGFGTLASQSSWWRRVGDTYYARGWITTGTVSGTTASLSPQSGIVIDSAKLDSTANLQRVGFIDRTGSTTTYTALGPLPIFYDGSTTGSLFMSGTTAAGYAFVKEAGSSSFNTGGKYPFEFSIPVSGWWE